MDFIKWLNETATITKNGIGIDQPPTDINDDDSNDDNDDLDWDTIDKLYGRKIQEWIDSSPCGKKIKLKILEKIFAVKPKFENHDVESDDDGGFVEVSAQWEYPVESLRIPLFNALRDNKNCDIYKAFDIKPEETWNFLDKGDVFDYVYYKIQMSLSGINTEVIKTLNSPKDYLKGTKDWSQDKITIQKYAQFQAKEIEESLREKYSNELSLNLQYVRQPKCRGQVFKENFFAEAYFIWKY